MTAIVYLNTGSTERIDYVESIGTDDYDNEDNYGPWIGFIQNSYTTRFIKEENVIKIEVIV